jgi:hypothetical protein
MAWEPAAAYHSRHTAAEREGGLVLADTLGSARQPRARPSLWEEADQATVEVRMRRRDRRNVNRHAMGVGFCSSVHAPCSQSASNSGLVCSLLAEVASKEAAAAGKLDEAGEGIRRAVHPRYLGHVADEPVERDVPATMRD